MKVTLITLNSFVNDIRAQKVATSLVSAGYEVSVIALFKDGLQEEEYFPGYKVTRIRLRTRNWKNRLFAPPIKYLEFLWKVWRYVVKHTSNIYQANDANTLPAAYLAALVSHAKLVYDARELETGRNFKAGYISGIYQVIWALPERIFIRKADAVLTVSPMIAEKMSQQYDVIKPIVIFNCPFKSAWDISNRLRDELNIPENKFIVLYHGLVAKGRGIESFIAAVQLVEEIVGVVLGDGPLLPELKIKANSGVWERIYLPGRYSISDISEYTSSSDLGVVLTQDSCLNHRLTLPNKLFDYMHAGLPIICSDLPALTQIIRKYQIGELVNPDDPLSIAQGIRNILDGSGRYEKMKENAFLASEIFTWQNEQIKLFQVYEKLSSD